MSLEFSIIIPTFNRLDVLPEVLAAVEGQSGAPEFELLVVDDGSTDGTAEWLAAWQPSVPTRLFRQENAGPAVARNRGVQEALGRRVAFLGDDTVPQAGWLAAHLVAHEARGGGEDLAVIGYTGWHPRMRRTPFLDYINDHGLQFGYALIEDAERVPFNFFYTSNLSLYRSRLLAEPFDTKFPYPAWEDIEVSYRLGRLGQRLVYESAAVVEHDHPTDFGRFARRQEKAGYSAVVFYRLHPELGSFLGLSEEGPPAGPPRWRRRLVEGVVRGLQFLPLRMPALWDEALRSHYIAGLRRGWADQAGLNRLEEVDHVSDQESQTTGPLS